ncbi:MAG: PKD domain-containing protein, partial [Dehalococcoidia bacterium]
TVYDEPGCHISADPGTEVCAGTDVTLTEDGGDAVSWNWTTGETTSFIVVSASDTYGVTITDANGCESYCDITVTVMVCEVCGAVAPDFSICVDTPLDDDLFITNGADCSMAGGCTMTDLDYSRVDSSEPGTYDYTVTCSDGVSSDTDTGTVTVLPEPTADFTVDKTSGCAPLTVVFTDQSTGNPGSWSWDVDGDGIEDYNIQNPSHTYASTGTYTVSLTVSNACGSDTETKPNYIEVIVCDGNPVIISVTQSSDEPCADEDVVITAHVTDDVGVTSVTLEYDTTEVPMSLDSGTPQNGYWVATIPGQPAGTTLTIYVIAYDGAGNSAQYGPHYKTWIECVGPVLEIVKTDDPDPVEPGETLTYTIIVTNTGNATATGVTVIDDYDETVLNITGADGGFDNGDTITWDGGLTIPSGGSLSYTITATVSPAATRGSIFYNTADVTCTEGPPDSDTESTEVATIPVTPSGGGGGGCPEIKYLTVDWEGNNTTKPLYSNGKLAADLLGPNSDLSHSLLLERGTHAPLAGGRTYYLIVVRELEETEIPSLTDNTVAIVVFNITPVGAVFDRDIFLTLGIDELPENTLNVTMAYYDDVNEVWETLEFEAGGPSGVAELTLSTAINHFSIFGVLAEVAPPPPPPAHFEASGLSIVPGVEKIWQRITFVTKTGQSVIITANVANDGGQEGDCTVALKLNGETVDTNTVRLGPGQSQPVSFTASGLDYGQYDVEVNELSGEFTASRTINWWLIIVIIVAIGLIIWGVVWGRRRRRRAQQEA